MDINIAFLNSQSDFSVETFHPIENKQDFSFLIESEINSSEQIMADLNDECTRKTENITLSLGKEVPVEDAEIKELRSKFKSDLEKKDDDLIYNTIFNPVTYQPEHVKLKTDYTQIVNIIQTALDENFKSQEDIIFPSEHKNEIKVDSFFQNKDELTRAENLAFSFNLKTDKSLNLNHESQDVREDEGALLEKIELNSDESKAVELNLFSAELTVEGKSKTKIQSQLSAYENISEFNENTTSIDNEYIQTDSQAVFQKSDINYDPNKTEYFEKELGDRLVSMVKESEHQVKLKITPPELGNIDIDLSLTEDQANVSFYTANSQVKAAIEASITELKNLFNEQSLSLGDVHVFHQASDDSKRQSQHFYEKQINENAETASIKKSEKERINKPLSSNGISVFV